MMDYLPIQLNGITVYLLVEKCVFLPHTHTLVIADVHLGKAAHFRKSGIIIPSSAGTQRDYKTLHHLIVKYNPNRIIFLGDLFHSIANASWQYFLEFVNCYPWLNLILILGNHDILSPTHYDQANLLTYKESLIEDKMIFSHAPLDNIPYGMLNMAGHIHPAASLKGLGKQSLKLPCFHFQYPYFLLPAFGSLTGTFLLPKGDGQQFVVTGKVVKEI
ncbi:ligase-associated DNA damage response endonuclease PdeM [Olivibacter ginsenosidimutans]|uniref:Ligase-associated DNA damage response endonuclease PdeM n=1 Tax=Olivibacter ginsenosidimutans TaxID=1176537 RepID=A0ABP9C373_9SPHI